MRDHAKSLDLAWPYSEAIRASKLRMMKIEALMREKGMEPEIIRLETTPEDSIEGSLKMDAALLKELDQYYLELLNKNTPDTNPQIIIMLDEDVKRYRLLLEHHNGIPPDKLREYAEKKEKALGP